MKLYLPTDNAVTESPAAFAPTATPSTIYPVITLDVNAVMTKLCALFGTPVVVHPVQRIVIPTLNPSVRKFAAAVVNVPNAPVVTAAVTSVNAPLDTPVSHALDR